MAKESPTARVERSGVAGYATYPNGAVARGAAAGRVEEARPAGRDQTSCLATLLVPAVLRTGLRGRRLASLGLG